MTWFWQMIPHTHVIDLQDGMRVRCRRCRNWYQLAPVNL